MGDGRVAVAKNRSLCVVQDMTNNPNWKEEGGGGRDYGDGGDDVDANAVIDSDFGDSGNEKYQRRGEYFYGCKLTYKLI